MAGLLRRYWSALAGAPFWLYAGGVAPCPEPRGLKARRPVFRQVLTPRLPSLSLGAAVRSQTERPPTMEIIRELPADSTRAILSGLAIQQRERETSLQRLARLRKEASAEIDRLIAFLDASDPYVMTELEEVCEDEGAQCEGGGGEEGCEDEGADRSDYEPSLGSVDHNHTQERWAAGSRRDLELDGAESGIGDLDGLLEQVGTQDWQQVVMA